MDRRDFLRLRVVREEIPSLDLECHALYMRWVEASRAVADRASASDQFDPLQGEPPAAFDTPSRDDILRQLEADLATVRRLRLLDGEWLQTTGLGDRVIPLLDAFRASGGTIVFDSTEAY